MMSFIIDGRICFQFSKGWGTCPLRCDKPNVMPKIILVTSSSMWRKLLLLHPSKICSAWNLNPTWRFFRAHHPPVELQWCPRLIFQYSHFKSWFVGRKNRDRDENYEDFFKSNFVSFSILYPGFSMMIRFRPSIMIWKNLMRYKGLQSPAACTAPSLNFFENSWEKKCLLITAAESFEH